MSELSCNDIVDVPRVNYALHSHEDAPGRAADGNCAE